MAESLWTIASYTLKLLSPTGSGKPPSAFGKPWDNNKNGNWNYRRKEGEEAMITHLGKAYRGLPEWRSKMLP